MTIKQEQLKSEAINILKEIRRNIDKLKNILTDKDKVYNYLVALHGQFSNVELKLHELKENQNEK